MMPKIDGAFPAGSIIRDASLSQPDWSKLVSMATVLECSGNVSDKSKHGVHMRNIVNEDGEIIA